MIYVECVPDEALVRFISGVPKREVAHEYQGKGGVCNRLKRVTGCKALVDEDPGSIQPAYLEALDNEKDAPHLGMRLLSDKRRNNLVVVLCPRLEEWVLKAALDVGVDVSGHGYPSKAHEFKKMINHDMRKFDKLLSDLAAAARLKMLKRWLG